MLKNVIPVNSQLFIIGGGEIQSMEGTTQGDPAAMVIYAIAIIPLILMLVEIRMLDNIHTKTAAYADDLTVAGPISIIYNLWWRNPVYGGDNARLSSCYGNLCHSNYTTHPYLSRN